MLHEASIMLCRHDRWPVQPCALFQFSYSEGNPANTIVKQEGARNINDAAPQVATVSNLHGSQHADLD
jgi:hypothetical protein